MKRILVPTDFSPEAENALEVAAQIAHQNKSEIYLEHSLNLPSHVNDNGSSGAMPESLYFIKLAEKEFEPLLQKSYLDQIDVHKAIGHSEIFEDIKTAVNEKNIDLIVMGSHGTSGFKELFIGSNTEKVVRTSEVPVLIIKNPHPTFVIKDMVFATDCAEECRRSFDQAQKFAREVGAKLHILYVNTPAKFKTTEDTNTMQKEFIKGMGVENYTLNVYNDHSVEKGILGFARLISAQLVGVSTHGRKGIAHFFNGSISEDLANHANMPVITFRI